MKKEILLSNRLQLILKNLFILSCSALTLVLSRNCDKWILILSMVLSLFIGIFLVKKFWKNNFDKVNVFKLFISFLITDLFLGIIYNYHYDMAFSSFFYNVAYWKLLICIILSIFSLTLIVYYLWYIIQKPIISFFKSLTKREKIFLIIYSLIFLVLTIIIYNLTKAFYFIEGLPYDIIYTTDSSAIFRENAFLNINAAENYAARQPLFGVFSVPFAIISFILSKIFFMIPNSYAVFLTWVQIVLIGLMMIMLSRLLKIKDENKLFFYLFFISCFSTIIFTFTLEQYIISTFYLILAIYVYFNMERGINYPFAMSVGTITTSAWFFPLAAKDKGIKKWFVAALKCLVFFMIVTILSGQLYFIFDFISGVFSNVDSFGGGGISFTNKLQQYLGFVKSIFLSIPGRVIDYDHSKYWYEEYLLEPIYNFSKVGIIILLVCLVSVILNRKNKMSFVSFFWLIFSIILILVVGYGTKENGTNLYSFYFGWAFICLVYLFIDKLIKNDKIKNILIIIMCVCMLILNISEFLNIINFGIWYYPV